MRKFLSHADVLKECFLGKRSKYFSSGQMTVEFVIVFPVLIAIALISTNALLFFSECASFDRLFREEVCLYGSSPGYGIHASQTAAKVSQELNATFCHDFETISVSCAGGFDGLTTFSGKLEFTPTLFGSGSLSSVFGVALPKLSHSTEIVIDVYKPGVLF